MKKAVVIVFILIFLALIGASVLTYTGYVIVGENQRLKNSLNVCSDSDGGKNYAQAGTVTWTFNKDKKYVLKDFCSFGWKMKTRITEYYCTPEKTAAPIAYDCSKEGKACLNGPDGAYCG